MTEWCVLKAKPASGQAGLGSVLGQARKGRSRAYHSISRTKADAFNEDNFFLPDVQYRRGMNTELPCTTEHSHRVTARNCVALSQTCTSPQLVSPLMSRAYIRNRTDSFVFPGAHVFLCKCRMYFTCTHFCCL